MDSNTNAPTTDNNNDNDKSIEEARRIFLPKNKNQRILDYFRIVPKSHPDLNDEQEKIPKPKPDPGLLKLVFKERSLLSNIKRSMVIDLMDDGEKEIKRKKKKLMKDSENNNESDENKSNDISLDEEENRVIRHDDRCFVRPPIEFNTLNVNSSPSDQSSSSDSICRRRTIRNEYFYIFRDMHIFNLIRYSFTSPISRKFLKTIEGQTQVQQAVEKCRNPVIKIIPEEEKAEASKILLISQKSIKQAKRSAHKFRNSGWHRQLNQSVKFEPLFYQSNLKTLKKGFENDWFIEEKNEEEESKPEEESILEKNRNKKIEKVKVYSKIRPEYKSLLKEKQPLGFVFNKSRSTAKLVQIPLEHEKPKVVEQPKQPKKTEPIKLCRLAPRDFDPPSRVLDSFETFRKYEKKIKKNHVNPFDGARVYVRAYTIMKEAGFQDIDISIMDDVEKMKALYIRLSSHIDEVRLDPELYRVYRMIKSYIMFRTQYMRAESKGSKFDEDMSTMIEAFKEHYPFNPFEPHIQSRERPMECCIKSMHENDVDDDDEEEDEE